MKRPIYMDNHATTPLDPRVMAEMLPYFREHFGNAHSPHSFGEVAHKAIETARAQVAAGVGASPKEIVFTSGATESNNLAIKGAARALCDRGKHIVTVATEHTAVIDVCRSLEAEGIRVTYLPVDSNGLITAADVEAALSEDTILVSVMHANNEIGVVQPIEAIGALCRRRQILFHTDAAQSVGKLAFDLDRVQADLVSISAHKLYGPKGVGSLVVRHRRPPVSLLPLIDGGGHERGLRSGTLPVPLIVGFGKAVELSVSERESEADRLLALRTRLLTSLQAQLDHIYVNGDLDARLPGNLNVSFSYVEGQSLLDSLKDEVAVSPGSACTTLDLSPSHVLLALGVGKHRLHSSLRFGLGRFNTAAEVDTTVHAVVSAVNRLRSLSPIWDMVVNGEDPDAVVWTPATSSEL